MMIVELIAAQDVPTLPKAIASSVKPKNSQIPSFFQGDH